MSGELNSGALRSGSYLGTGPHDRARYFTCVTAGIAALAWAALFWLHGSSAAHHMHSHGATILTAFGGAPGAGGLRGSLLFLASWLLMIAAMMLPTVLPLVENIRLATRNRPDQMETLSLFLAGYISIWSAFGLLLLVLGSAAGRLAGWPMESRTFARSAAAAVFIVAGVFQFLPVKYRCLHKCRTRLDCVSIRGGPGSASFRLGLHHGACCVGCCWGLMLLMFIAGSAQLAWMLALTIVMAVEKNAPWGRRLAKPIGALLLGAAIFSL